MRKELPSLLVTLPQADDLNIYSTVNESAIYSLELDNFQSVRELGNRFEAIVPIRCAKCSIVILWEDHFEESDRHSRAMGVESVYHMYIDATCCRCESEMLAHIYLRYYAGRLHFDEYQCRRCHLAEVGGLNDLMLQWVGENKILSTELNDLLEERDRLSWRNSHLYDLVNDMTYADRHSPKYVLITEGRDDVFVWRGLMQCKGIEPDEGQIRVISPERAGGVDGAIAAYQMVSKLNLSCKVRVVIDSDNKKDEVSKKLRLKGLNKNTYHVLNLKEIESYLFDQHALSVITGISEESIDAKMKILRRRGKEGLDQLCEMLHLPHPDANFKYLIARRLSTIPEELDVILKEIKYFAR